MNQAFYAAAVAASQQQQSINVVSNNVSNINTVGYRSQQAKFAELLYQGFESVEGQVFRGTGSRMVQTNTDFEEGTLIARTDGQNYAIRGNGFFGLLDPQTNEISYTRAGAFHWGSVQRVTENNGQETVYYLCDMDGRYVLDQNQQPIEMGEDSLAQYPVGVFDFANTDDMQHIEGNRMIPVAKNGPVMAGDGQVVFGAVESSNTDITVEMTKMIEAQRSYSYALKMVQTQDEITTTVNSLKG